MSDDLNKNPPSGEDKDVKITLDRSTLRDTEKFNFEKDLEPELRATSEKKYLEIVDNIVTSASNQLKEVGKFKAETRTDFLSFFKSLLIDQFICLMIFIILKVTIKGFALSENIIIVFIASVFVETLGVVGFMVKSVFNNDQEVNIIKVLSGVVEKFQKYSSNGKDS